MIALGGKKMTLKELLKDIDVKEIKGDSNIEIENLMIDNSVSCPKSLAFCYVGVKVDGHEFFNEAIGNGAVCIIVERFLPTEITQVKVDNVRKVIAKVCSNFYKNPENNLKIIGITGTNGKTTTSFMIRQILISAGKSVGLIGTTAIYINEVFYPTLLTTPDPNVLFKTFRQMVDAGVEWVVMEVSAHAIDLYKVYGVQFEAGVFTNLTQDHLDYFGDLITYANTKQKFLTSMYCKNCVFNVDDSFGKDFYHICDTKKFSYAIMNPSDVFALNLKMDLSGSMFVVNLFDDILRCDICLAGKFNVYNALAAITTCKVLGFDNKSIINGLENLKQVEGRFNVLSLDAPFRVVVDYAHTPDGVENILKNIKALCNGKLITVFGCGGNRDALKRPIMGEIATKYSNLTIITSDNPRFENPYNIIEQIKQGADPKSEVLVIENRREAIIKALNSAFTNDVVAILGKGAEDYQEINGIKYPFNDSKVVKEYITRLSKFGSGVK